MCEKEVDLDSKVCGLGKSLQEEQVWWTREQEFSLTVLSLKCLLDIIGDVYLKVAVSGDQCVAIADYTSLRVVIIFLFNF